MDKRLLIEIAVGIVVFLLSAVLSGYINGKGSNSKRKLRVKKEFGGMELIGICKGDNPSPPQNEGVYRLELYCTNCKLWNMYEGEELPSIHANIKLGCCSSTLVDYDNGKRRINISGDRRAYYVNTAVQVFKQFNNDDEGKVS